MILLDPELTRLHERFTSATCPEDLFGLLVGDDSQRLKMLERIALVRDALKPLADSQALAVVGTGVLVTSGGAKRKSGTRF